MMRADFFRIRLPNHSKGLFPPSTKLIRRPWDNGNTTAWGVCGNRRCWSIFVSYSSWISNFFFLILMIVNLKFIIKKWLFWQICKTATLVESNGEKKSKFYSRIILQQFQTNLTASNSNFKRTASVPNFTKKQVREKKGKSVEFSSSSNITVSTRDGGKSDTFCSMNLTGVLIR